MTISGSDHLKRVIAGQPLAPAASTWNTFIDTAQQVRRQQQRIGGGLLPGALYSPIMTVENTSETDVDWYGVLGLEDFLIAPSANLNEFQNWRGLTATVPDGVDHVGRFAIALEPIAGLSFGRALLAGVIQVQVNVPAGMEAVEFADVKDGDATQLELNPAGAARVLTRETGTGTKWAWVQFPAVRPSIIMARITDRAALGGASNRWKYAWSEQELSGDGWQNKTGGLSGTTTTDYALNMVEANNTSTHVAPGIDLEGEAYPAGFAPMAIGVAGDSVEVEPVVPLWQVRDASGNRRWVFHLANAHDGGCT